MRVSIGLQNLILGAIGRNKGLEEDLSRKKNQLNQQRTQINALELDVNKFK